MSNRENLTFIDPEPFYKLADRPEWLLGGEEGANPPHSFFHKDEVLFALVSLTFYSEFNASMGFQLLYNIASSQENVVCERIFYPEIKVERFLREHKIPLFSLESKLAAFDFDILAWSIFHIPEYLNLLEMFDLSALPYKAEDRLGGKYPLVIAGGIFTLNPEPLAPFFDVICIGDGDDWLIGFLDFYRNNRERWENGNKESKLAFLTELAETVDGTYVPLLTEVSYDDSASRIRRETSVPSQATIRKRVCDITRQDSRYLKNVIMSRTEKEAFTKAVEVARGCRWGCRFCVVTAFYRPYRERPLHVLKEVVDYRARLGVKQIGVGAPTPPDYSRISDLANYIIGKGLRFDIQSERLDTFSFESARAHVLSGRGNVSLAIEAPCGLTRKQINKNLDMETITEAATNGLRAGFRGMKWMFMLCHPWETPEQVKQFEPLLTHLFNLREKHNPRCFYRVSICPFIPKPWTTFQWAPLREDASLFKAANDAIESARRTPIGAHRFALQFAGGPTSRWFDTCFSRGDRRLADVFILVHLHGKPAGEMLYEFPYSAATRRCVDAIKGYCKALRLPLNRWIKGSDVSADLPWDFINIGVSKSWLQKDWERARNGVENISCKDGCAGCGACQAYSDLNLPHPNSYQNEPFRLDVSFRDFISARKRHRFHYPRRRFILRLIKSPSACLLNFQDYRRLITRCFSLTGYKANVRSVDCLGHLFEGGMRWKGVDWIDVQPYVPLDCDIQHLKEQLGAKLSNTLGTLTDLTVSDHSFKSDLEGVEVRVSCRPTHTQITDFLNSTEPVIMVRIDRVSEKKSGEGVTSEHPDIRQYLLGARLDPTSKYLLLEMKRDGSAYEFVQAIMGVPRKVAERFDVEVIDVLTRESWE